MLAPKEDLSLSLSLSTHSYDIYSMIRGYATLKFVFLWRWVQVSMLNNALETDVHRNNLNGNQSNPNFQSKQFNFTTKRFSLLVIGHDEWIERFGSLRLFREYLFRYFLKVTYL